MIKLYHYVHCPYCIRVRMTLGYLKMPFKSIVLSYEDESTPLALTGAKALPIISFNEKNINESLDIIKLLDQNNKLMLQVIDQELQDKIENMAQNIHSLVMPYWIYTQEFSINARNYFVEKKSKKRGPFNELMKNRSQFEKALSEPLQILESQLHPFYQSQQLTINDIIIASHLWGLYILPEFQFSNKLHNYLQEIKKITHFNYHEDFWEQK